MNRSVLRRRRSPAFVRAIEALEARRLLASVFWDGGGDTVNWMDPLNWSTNTLPGPGDDVVISLAASDPIIRLNAPAAPQSIRSLVSAEQLVVTATLQIETTATMSAPLRLSDGVIRGGIWDVSAANLTSDHGAFNSIYGCHVIGEIFLGGTQNTRLRVESGATFTHVRMSPQFAFANASLGIGPGTVVRGLITMEQGNCGVGAITSGGQITLAPDAVVRVQTGFGKVGTSAAFNADVTIVNEGLISFAAGQPSMANWTNLNTIEVANSAVLTVQGNWSNADGVVELRDAGSVILRGTYDRNRIGTLDRSPNSRVFLQGTLENAGEMLVLNEGTGSWYLEGATILGGTVRFEDGHRLMFAPSNSTLQDVQVDGELVFDIQSGTVLLAGNTRFSHALVTALGAGPRAAPGYVLHDTVTLASGQFGIHAGTVTIAPTGIVRGGGTIGRSDPGGTSLINQGLIECTAVMLTVTAALTNEGIVRATEGTIRLTGGGVNDGTIELADETQVEFNSSFSHTPDSVIVGSGALRILSGSHTLDDQLQQFAGSLFIWGNVFTVVDFNAPIKPTHAHIGAGTVNFNASQVMLFDVIIEHGAILAGSGDLTHRGTTTWRGGTIAGSGKMIIAPEATLDVTWESVELRRPLENHGMISMSRTINLLDAGVIDNMPGAVLEFAQAVGVVGTPGQACQFNNFGVVRSHPAGGAGLHIQHVEFNQSAEGSVHVVSSSFGLRGGGSGAGTFSIGNNASLFLSVDYNFDSSVTIAGPGAIRFEGGTHDLSGRHILTTGQMSVERSTVTIDTPINPSGVLLRGGTLYLNAPQTLSDVSLLSTSSGPPANSTLGGSGDVVITGALAWSSGHMRGTGKTTLAPGATTSGNLFGGTATLSREFHVLRNIGSRFDGQLRFGDGINSGILRIGPGVIFTLGAGMLSVAPGDHRLINEGTLRGLSGTTTITGIALHNHSEILVEGGTLNALGGGSQIDGAKVQISTHRTFVVAGDWDWAAGSQVVGAGGLGAFRVAGGMHTFDAELNILGAFQVENSAVVNFSSSPRTRPVTVSGGAVVRLVPDGSLAWVMRSISIDSSSGSRVDLADNAIVVDYVTPNPLGTPTTPGSIFAYVATGYAAGAWNGPGIVSSVAAVDPARYGIGFGESSSIFSTFPSIFAGVEVNSTTVLLRFTLNGDANLDGTVNQADFNRLTANFGHSPRAFTEGDFNYDGLVNLADFNILAARFGTVLTGNVTSTSFSSTRIGDWENDDHNAGLV